MKRYVVECWRCNAELELPLKIPNNVSIGAQGDPNRVFFELKCPVCSNVGKYSLSAFEVEVSDD